MINKIKNDTYINDKVQYVIDYITDMSEVGYDSMTISIKANKFKDIERILENKGFKIYNVSSGKYYGETSDNSLPMTRKQIDIYVIVNHDVDIDDRDMNIIKQNLEEYDNKYIKSKVEFIENRLLYNKMIPPFDLDVRMYNKLKNSLEKRGIYVEKIADSRIYDVIVKEVFVLVKL